MPAIVALSETDICNMALSHLSISTGIQSFSDQNAAAKTCAFWYPKCRDHLLRDAPWNFAYQSMQMVTDTTVFPGFGYAYQYPNDCLDALAVTTYAGQRFGSAYWAMWWSQFPVFNLTIPKIPFKVAQSQAHVGQLAIFCDIPAPAYLFYIQCVTNTAQFDVLFSDALSLFIASRIGGPLRANIQKVQACAQAAEAMKLRALAQTLNESQQDVEAASPSVQIRW